MTDVSNRRVHARRSARIPARLAHEGDGVDGIVENIGEGGVFFATETLELSVDDGAPVVLSFQCRRNGAEAPTELAGVVLRTERYFDGETVVRAFAIKFDALFDMDGVELD
jgi:hypothetical protein